MFCLISLLLCSCASEKTLNFQTTKAMDDAGVTVENSDNLKILADIVNEYPQMGEDNNFTIQYSGKYGNTNGIKQVTFFAINKTNQKIKNISFYLTMQVGEKYIFDSLFVELSEEIFGELLTYSAMPVSITIDSESYPLLEEINNDNLKLVITDISFE